MKARYVPCPKCGRNMKIGLNNLCARCRNYQYQQEFKEAVIPPQRKCHDCGKKTNNYRCLKCWMKFWKKFDIPIEEAQNEMDIYIT